MKNINTILILLGVMFFIAFFASNTLNRPYIYFLWKDFWVMWIFYSTLVWMIMWWALRWIINWKSSSPYDWDDEDGF
jgi:hypothetical protein